MDVLSVKCYRGALQTFERLGEVVETCRTFAVKDFDLEKIGGKIGLLTTPEGYTEFYVILPAAPYQEWGKLMSKQG